MRDGQRLRHLMQAAIILSCLVCGGLSFGTDFRNYLAGKFSGLAVLNTSAAAADLHGASDLPAAVTQAISTVVAVQRITDVSANKGEVASGVIVGDGLVLTAGHTVYQGGQVVCANTNVITGSYDGMVSSSQTASSAAASYGKGNDVALLTLGQHGLQPTVKMQLAEQLPAAGEQIYFINYQPTADGDLRSPAAPSSNQAGAASLDYSKPVVFSATVLAQKNGRLVIAAGGGQSFSGGDRLLRQGASGGAIVNARGELVGLSVASDSLQAIHTATGLAEQYRVKLPADASYQLVYSQTVGSSAMQRLQSTTSSCQN